MSLSPHSTRAGFTLLELAVVLGIIALVLAFGLSTGTDAIGSAQKVNTQQRLKTIQLALESYVATNGYLPCPFDRALTPSSNGFGVEARLANTKCSTSGTGLVALPNAAGAQGYIGGIPVRTLGLPDSFAADAWHNKFTYAVSAPHVSGPSSYATKDPTITIYYGDRTGTHYAITTTNNLDVGAGATYAVVSHGPDGRGAFTQDGGTVPNSCTDGGRNDYENCDDANLDFYDTDYNDGVNTAQYFDDYIVWGSNGLRRAPAMANPYAGQGACAAGCESWCAPCSGTVPHLPTDPANITGPVLCRKVITSTAPCTATCVWSGTTPSGYVRCQ
jgi:prepilin-type N-terminal cleavage/methylation domain-containing protein